MRRRFHCRYCVIEMERVVLADGTAALLCVDCDLIGLEREIVNGGRLWPAGLAARRRSANKHGRGCEREAGKARRGE